MKRPEYDIQISGEMLQPIEDVSVLGGKHSNPDRYAASFAAPRLKSKLGSLQPNELCVVDAGFTAIDIGEDTTADLIDLGDEFAHARGQSRTEVRFAQLVLEDEIVGQKAELVAVKYTDPALAAREFAAMNRVNAVIPHPFAQSSFRPLGFVNNAEQSEKLKRPVIGLITDYEHEVLTLDRVFWNRGATPEPQVVMHVLGRAAAWMATLHAAEIAHGDAQPKNIAEGNVRAPRYVDLESAVNLSVKEGVLNKALAQALVREDLETFLTHLEGDYTDFVSEHFARPYVEHMEQVGKSYVGEVTEDEIIRIAQLPQKRIARFGQYL
jgi:hypothetical protein